MAVLGQNIRTGSREVEIDSIKCFIVVLTPGPADAISVLPLIRYCGENAKVFVMTKRISLTRQHLQQCQHLPELFPEDADTALK